MHPQDILWWSKGGILHGTSPERLAFLRKIVEESPKGGINPINYAADIACGGKEGEYYMMYFSFNRPSFRLLELPEDSKFKIEVIDTWNMTITPVEGEFSGKFRLDLPGRQYIALRITKII